MSNTKLKRSVFKVALAGGEVGTRRGYILGDWAVHKDRPVWRVTHIPTGIGINTWPVLERKEAALSHLRELHDKGPLPYQAAMLAKLPLLGTGDLIAPAPPPLVRRQAQEVAMSRAACPHCGRSACGCALRGERVREPELARSRPEARLEREILAAVGAMPDVLALKNEVGLGYRRALKEHLCPSCSVAAERHVIRFGMGAGSPDLILSVAGHFLGLELKSARGRASAEQSRWHEAARARGANVAVVADLASALEQCRRMR